MSWSIFCQSTSDSNFLNAGGGSSCNSWRVLFFICASSLPSPGFSIFFFAIFNGLFWCELPRWFPSFFFCSIFVARAPIFEEERQALGTQPEGKKLNSQLATIRSWLKLIENASWSHSLICYITTRGSTHASLVPRAFLKSKTHMPPKLHQHGSSVHLCKIFRQMFEVWESVHLCKIFRQIFEVWESVQT